RYRVGPAVVGQNVILDVEDAPLRIERRLHVLLVLPAISPAPAPAAPLPPEPAASTALAGLLLLSVRRVLGVPRVPRLGRVMRRLGVGPRRPLSFTVHLSLHTRGYEPRLTSSAND
ncbi:MAG TPA: hypothetical protein VG496_02445, partial [Myxococcales bacterium]|nr:hypothetical protein [Myxococcales bacterium]